MALAGVGARGDGDAVSAAVAQRNCSRSARIWAAASAREPAERSVDVEGPLEEGAEGAHLAAGGAAGALGAGVGVPGAGEVGDGGAGAVSVRGEHRADAARRGVDVGADDDAVRVDAAEHGFLRVLRKALDGDAKVVCGALAAVLTLGGVAAEGGFRGVGAGLRRGMLQVEDCGWRESVSGRTGLDRRVRRSGAYVPGDCAWRGAPGAGASGGVRDVGEVAGGARRGGDRVSRRRGVPGVCAARGRWAVGGGCGGGAGAVARGAAPRCGGERHPHAGAGAGGGEGGGAVGDADSARVSGA